MSTAIRCPLIILLLGLCTNTAFAQQGLIGVVTNELGEPVIGGNVKIMKGESFITGSATDFDGNYQISLDPGTYNVEFSYVGYTPEHVEDIKVTKGSFVKHSIAFTNSASTALFKQEGCTLRAPPIDVGETTQGMIIRGRELRRVSKPN